VAKGLEANNDKLFRMSLSAWTVRTTSKMCWSYRHMEGFCLYFTYTVASCT